MKCIKIDKDRCVVIGADIPYEVECSDPDLFVELFNADVSTLDLSEGNKLNIEIIKKLKMIFRMIMKAIIQLIIYILIKREALLKKKKSFMLNPVV
ncbi:hypothetical protein [Lysinibacillus xylanilyticus]|uniref:hypothetical protein n=1 Tax=Lysinibacillus xylanilyticus TaxID=582475 RepID=UPI003D073163